MLHPLTVMQTFDEQGHIICNQYAAECGNVLQAHKGVVVKHSPATIYRKHGALTIKEEGCSDNINVVD